MEPVCVFLLTPGRPLDAGEREDLGRRLGVLAAEAGPTRALACVGKDAAGLKDLAALCGLSVAVLAPGRQAAGAAGLPWPPGAAEALAAAQERFPGLPCVLADALRTDLQPTLLQAFLAAVARSPDAPMIALQPLRDHPCQLLHYFTLEDMLALSRARGGDPAAPAGILAAGEGEDGSRWQWEVAQGGDSVLSRLPCAWPRPSEARRETLLHVEILDVAGNSLGRVMAPVPQPGRTFTLGPLEETAQSLLLCLLGSGAGEYHFQAAHPGIDGLWRMTDNGDVFLEQTGRLLTGRQDFPPLYLPDGLLAYLPAKADFSADAGLRGFPLDCEPLPRLDEGSALERLLAQKGMQGAQG